MDALSFIFTGLTHSALEKDTVAAFMILNNLLQDFHLQISSDKSDALTFTKPQDLKNRPPTLCIKSIDIPRATSNKI